MIEFQAIKEAGLIERERVVFRVTEAGDIGKWMLHCVLSRLGDDGIGITNKILGSYWFQDKQVEVADLVVVYTKDSNSTYKLKKSSSGSKNTHFFYWGRERAVWDQKDVAVVFGRFIQWKTHIVDLNVDDEEPLVD